MKRSSNNCFIDVISFGNKKKKIAKVKNSLLDSNVSFIWPKAKSSFSAFISDDDEVNTTAGGKKIDEILSDTTDFYGRSDETSVGDDVIYSSFSPLERDGLFMELLDKDGSLDFPRDIFLSSNLTGSSYSQEEESMVQNESYIDATLMMGQECADYFMTEYESSSYRSQMSFANFVTISLDKISSFRKESKSTNSNISNLMMKNVGLSSPADNDDILSRSAFSIKEWRAKVAMARSKQNVVSNCIASKIVSSTTLQSDQWFQWHGSDGGDLFDSFGEV